ncbi:MAG TPA: DUF3048 domain-containing protein [Patescibacteria group bacterium]
MMPKRNLPVLIGFFLLLAGTSYFAFDKLLPVKSAVQSPVTDNSADNSSDKPSAKTGVITFSGPKTAVCPINGQLFTEEEKNIWSTRRPLEVMIENHSDARPQSGLQNADIVYEAVAEGGITRFMGVFYCNAVKGSANKYDVGPVRSARTYFLDLASEYADYPLYAHVGGANCSAATPGGPCTTNKKALAIEQIAQYGWNNKGTWGDLSQFSLSYKVCRREPDRIGDGVVRATEHTMYCSTKEFWNTAADRGLTNLTQVNSNSWDKNYRPWSFKAADAPAAGDTATSAAFSFWTGYKDYDVTWTYDKSSNSYLRSNGGKSHIDFNTGKQISSKNIVLQFVKESRSVDEHLHNLYDVIGTGKAVLLQNGVKQEITWTKANRLARTIFKDKTGKEVNFVPGLVWVELIPQGNDVKYEI